MPEQTTPDQRRSFFADHAAGLSYRQIADSAHVSAMCVRYWCRRLAKGQRPETVYARRPAGLLHSFPAVLRYVLLRLRLEHPHWGPSRLRYHLGKRPSLAGQRLPSCASIGYYLHQWPRFRRPVRVRIHAPAPMSPTMVHEEWQVDYKMGIPTADGCLVNRLDIRDPVGAAAIGAFEHPGGTVGHRPHRLTVSQVRRDLRLCFAAWQTLPQRIRTDNEGVFSGQPGNDFPSQFSLWLRGLGIAHHTIRPGRPTDQAPVERLHRTIDDYCATSRQATSAERQARLDEALHELNQELPSRAHGCHGRPPLCAHPDLLQPCRPFTAIMEVAQFDLQRVDRYLATLTWTRKVGQKGQVKLGGTTHRYIVGHKYAGQRVRVRFDPQDRSFVFYGRAGNELRRSPCRWLDIDDLVGAEPWPDGPGIQQLCLPLDLTPG
jgi:transposase InsO family protein